MDRVLPITLSMHPNNWLAMLPNLKLTTSVHAVEETNQRLRTGE
jgi:hypothetical protein